MPEMIDLLSQLKKCDRINDSEKVVFHGDKGSYELCRYLKTDNNIEYYSCKGNDGLWRIVGIAKIHRYNERVEELAIKLERAYRECREVEAKYDNDVINKAQRAQDVRAADEVRNIRYRYRDWTESNNEWTGISSTWNCDEVEYARFRWIGQRKHYAWLLPKVVERLTVPELRGRRAIVLEPQNIDLSETVSLNQLLSSKKWMNVDEIAWILAWLCRAIDFLLQNGTLLKIDIDNIYVETSAKRLFLLDWSDVFFLKESYFEYKGCERRCGIDHFLMNLHRLGEIGLALLGVECDDDGCQFKDEDQGAIEDELRDEVINRLYYLYRLDLRDGRAKYLDVTVFDDDLENCLEHCFRSDLSRIYGHYEMEKMCDISLS